MVSDRINEGVGKYRVGVDLGGTKIEAILLDAEGGEGDRRRTHTPRDTGADYDRILRSVHSLITEMAKGVPAGQEYTVGIGVPGALDLENDQVVNANTVCLKGRPFRRDMEALVGRPVGVENDANCFALAESQWGAATDHRFVFGIIMGTGCGGGICIDGRIHRGRNGLAGEWGHFSVDPQGLECFCGNRGCVETKLSGTGLSRSFYARYAQDMTAQQILEGYRQGDPRCRAHIEQFLDDFGRCVGGLISTIDPDIVVLGGGLSNVEELYDVGVEKVRRCTFRRNITTPILKNRLGDSAGVLGAALIGV